MVDVLKNSSRLKIYLASVLNLLDKIVKHSRGITKAKYGILAFQSLKLCIHQHPLYGLGEKQNTVETIATKRHKTQLVIVGQVDLLENCKYLN